MGRASLVFVILMTSIFAGVLVRIQSNIAGVPDVLIRNQLNKEIENVSDYVLRAAVRNANSEEFLNSVLSGADVVGQISHTQTFAEGEKRIGNCDILSIEYSYAHSGDHYKVKTHIRGFMQGVEVFRDAEMAFSYPMATLGKVVPNVVYLEFERLLLFTWLTDIIEWLTGIEFNNRMLADSSGNYYESDFNGFSLISPAAPYTIDEDALDEEVDSWGGAYSKRYLKFNGYNNWVNVNNKLPVDSVLVTDTEFSLMCFAKIDKNGRNASLLSGDRRDQQGTLLWIPSEYNESDMQHKPSAAIYFETTNKNSATGKMHYVITLEDKSELRVTIDYTRQAVVWRRIGISFLSVYRIDPNHAQYPWNSYGLTFETKNGKSILTAYVDGVQVGQAQKDGEQRAYPSKYGMSIGRKALNSSFHSDDDRKYFFGIMDQSGMDDRAFTPYEMKLWHDGVMKSTLVKYIKD